jgi:hypothetical protein
MTNKQKHLASALTMVPVFGTYTRVSGHKLPQEKEDAVADMLCDLMHYCSEMCVDFEEALATARLNYTAES